MNTRLNAWFFFLPVLLTGCFAGSSDKADLDKGLTERYALTAPPHAQTAPPEGSIYNVDAAHDIYEDRRARRIGDIVLVKIVETSSGAKKAETKTERTSTVTGGVSALFGLEQWYSDKNRYFTPSATSLSGTLTNDFDGKGETKRNSTVTATLSARVIDVAMDGNLIIRGYREVRVNNETQHIILSGLVRPQDISADNSILSSYIADARIEYSGTGAIADKQEAGWLARALDVIWPF